MSLGPGIRACEHAFLHDVHMAEKGLTADGSTTLVTRIRNEDRERVDQRARELGISRGELVRMALDDFFSGEHRSRIGNDDSRAQDVFARLRSELANTS